MKVPLAIARIARTCGSAESCLAFAIRAIGKIAAPDIIGAIGAVVVEIRALSVQAPGCSFTDSVTLKIVTISTALLISR